MLINTNKKTTQKGSVILTGNGKYTVTDSAGKMLTVVHNSLTNSSLKVKKKKKVGRGAVWCPVLSHVQHSEQCLVGSDAE